LLSLRFQIASDAEGLGAFSTRTLEWCLSMVTCKIGEIPDVPVELGRELTGFRHDQDISGVSGAVFQVLKESVMFRSPNSP